MAWGSWSPSCMRLRDQGRAVGTSVRPLGAASRPASLVSSRGHSLTTWAPACGRSCWLRQAEGREPSALPLGVSQLLHVSGQDGHVPKPRLSRHLHPLQARGVGSRGWRDVTTLFSGRAEDSDRWARHHVLRGLPSMVSSRGASGRQVSSPRGSGSVPRPQQSVPLPRGAG